jgi:hypothetical protein
MAFLYTRRFLRSLSKLPEEVQNDVIVAVERFKKKSEHKTLRLHKLSGRMKKYYAFSANFSFRIIVEIGAKDVYFLDVGTHDVYE